MSYAALETSAYRGQPVEFYRFSSGIRKWLYTSADAAQVYLSETYEPYPLKRGAFRQTQELAKATLEINTPRDTPFVADMVASPLMDVALLTIYRRHRPDAEVIQYWSGRIPGVRFENGEAVITGDPWATATRRIGLRRPAQRLCPHALYDIGCKVASAVYSLSGNLVSNAGDQVTSGLFATHADGWWIGGKIVLDGVLRFVIDHVGDTLTLICPVPGLAQNASFVAYPGCDHTIATCDAKFGNSANFGGAPWFPVKNPFTGDSPA